MRMGRAMRPPTSRARRPRAPAAERPEPSSRQAGTAPAARSLLGRCVTSCSEIRQELTPALWLWVFHPGVDSPEHEVLIHTDPGDVFTRVGVAKHRAEETKVLTNPEVRSIILQKGIKLTNYKELWLQIAKPPGN